MKEAKIFNKQNIQIFGATLEESEIVNWIELLGEAKGKPIRWILASEPHDEADVLETEEREIWTQTDPNEETDSAVMDKETWVKLKAEYTIEIEDYNPVPQSVSPMQIRLALNELGLRTTIENAVDSGSQDLKDMWKFASEFKRDYPLIEELSVSLGFTKEQVDNIFRLAVTK